MDAQFIVPNKLTYEKRENKYGANFVRKKKDTYKPPKNSKNKVEVLETDYECKYSGKWILGTEFTYGYGKAKNQLRAKSALNKTRLDYIIYAPNIDFMKNQSMCERMIPFADQIQLAHLKIQQLLAKARPKGLAMELGSIENVQNGKGGTFAPLDIQDIHDQTGNYYYRLQEDDGSMSTAKPITELEGGVGSALQEMLGVYQHNLAMIRDVTGINESRDGSIPNKDSVVGVAKLNLLASNNATRSINDAYLNIYRRTAESAVLMIQDLAQYHKPYQGYVRAIGQMHMEAIQITKDVSLHEFGLLIEAEPTGLDKENLERDIAQSLSKKELRLEDAMMIRRIKNIKMAEEMLKLKRREYEAELVRVAAANSQANTEAAQIAIQQKFEADAALLSKKTDEEIRKATAIAEIDDMKAQKDHIRAMELQELENEGKVEVAEKTSIEND
jgi:hypothetical protein